LMANIRIVERTALIKGGCPDHMRPDQWHLSRRHALGSLSHPINPKPT